jgi:hypothetical protein
MTGDQSRKRWRPRCWRGTTNDQGTVSETNWAGVTVRWDNSSEKAILHNDMLQIERVPNKLV